MINFGSEAQHHVAWVATMTFAGQHGGSLPRPNSDEDAAEVVEIAKRLIASKEIDIEYFEFDENFVKRYALHAGVELQPMCAFFGGVVAQEVVKCSGKFTPIPGFFHFSAIEALPDERPVDVSSRGHRNDELAAVYGWPFVEALGNLRYFMVGCGALGCEHMKNFALNGLFCGPEGQLTVTDNDRIELSNLTRQFLFREHNVGQPKSQAARQMALRMNKDFKVNALELLAGAKSEVIHSLLRLLGCLFDNCLFGVRMCLAMTSGSPWTVCVTRWTTRRRGCTSTGSASSTTKVCWKAAPWVPRATSTRSAQRKPALTRMAEIRTK